ncbi:type VII secretion integral membrane protein EccD [Austwickia sp. TVS 96-490-7B]|uniref:type VII secretion integral membrane protein EccD n=1 Tax=Austwickia sp. TVS 96-490-7B TaxID=2830843 RepID=UPI001C56F7ED|nr:type VII secretion integral membrane protein EccD [Austwickia sp. TVS 96-490-7B]
MAPRTRIDVALPLDLTVGELLPAVLEMVGEREDPGTAHDGWVLEFEDGRRIDSSRTLRSLSVLDGTLLQVKPRGEVTLPVVYDDVIDAIATTVRDRQDERPIRSVTGSAVAGTMLILSALVLFYRGHQVGNAVLVLATTILTLIAAIAISRAGEKLLGVTLATAGAVHALVCGVVLIPGSYGYPGALLGFMLAVAYVACCLPLIPAAVVPLSAVGMSAMIGALGALAGVLLHATPPQVAAGAGCAAVASLSVLPWAVLRLAQLPMPVIPRDADDMPDIDRGLGIPETVRRAATAHDYFNGLSIGAGIAAGLSTALLISAPGTVARCLGVLIVAILVMRIRHVGHRTARLALVIMALVGLAIGVVLAVTTQKDAPVTALFAGLFVAGVAAVASTMLPQAEANPVTARALDLLDGLLIVALVPLAAGAMDLYTIVRHL